MFTTWLHIHMSIFTMFGIFVSHFLLFEITWCFSFCKSCLQIVGKSGKQKDTEISAIYSYFLWLKINSLWPGWNICHFKNCILNGIHVHCISWFESFAFSLDFIQKCSLVFTHFFASYSGHQMWHTCIWINIGSPNGLVPDSTKPTHEPMLTTHQWSLGAFSWG